jgi:hypothetical protein
VEEICLKEMDFGLEVQFGLGEDVKIFWAQMAQCGLRLTVLMVLELVSRILHPEVLLVLRLFS